MLRSINTVIKAIKRVKKTKDPSLCTDYMEKKRLLLAREIANVLEEGKNSLTFSKKTYRSKI